MHSIRPRPICRARNTFSPSIALWHNFVANQCQPHRLPASSFATEAAQSHDDRYVSPGLESSYPDSGSKVRLVREFRRNKTTGVKRSGPARFRYDTSNRKIYPGFRGERGQDLEGLLKQTWASFDSSQDYVGVVVQPLYSTPVTESAYPWVVPKGKLNLTGEERLNLEIKRFHGFIRPSQAENVARKHLIEQVRQHVRGILPKYVLEVFGSERTGMAFAGSDIDLRLIPEDIISDAARSKLPPSLQERRRRQTDLRRLHWHLVSHHKQDYLLPTIRWARYPLITLQDRASGLDVQVVLSNDTSISREYMQRYLREYPYLPEAYSVMKAALEIRGLTDVFRGGIGSYSLFMMIVASLKHRRQPSNNAAGAVEGFLHFWSHLKTDVYSVSIDPPELLDKSQQLVMHEKAMEHIKEGRAAQLPKWMPTIRDPADETNDLGRKIVAWKHVRVTLKSMLRDLRSEVVHNSRESLLATLVGPVYMLQKNHREKLLEYGKSLAQAARHYGAADVRGQTQETAKNALQAPVLEDLAAIARSIRENEEMAKQPAYEAKVEGTGRSEEDGLNPWLKDIESPSEHKQTEEAFSNLLGLDKKSR